MTIEQYAVRKYGVTNCPEFATFMLRNGTMLNGCFYGNMRTVDHAEIGQFFKKSKFQNPGDNTIYIDKFMRRGNIRMCCDNNFGYTIWMKKTPTREQVDRIVKIRNDAMKSGAGMLFYLIVDTDQCREPRTYDFDEWIFRYVLRYTKYRLRAYA